MWVRPAPAQCTVMLSHTTTQVPHSVYRLWRELWDVLVPVFVDSTGSQQASANGVCGTPVACVWRTSAGTSDSSSSGAGMSS